MDTLSAIIYGLIQGLTEFLPVSSSGHLFLLQNLGLGEIPNECRVGFNIILHLATLIAVIAYFYKEIIQSLKYNIKFWIVGAIAIIPAGLFGVLCKDTIKNFAESFWMIGIAYLLSTILLFLADKIQKKQGEEGTKELYDITNKQSAIVGFLQIFALFPGVSRSGSTIAGGLFGKMHSKLAVSFSFLVGIPLIAGAAAKEALDEGSLEMLAKIGYFPMTIAFLTSLLSGLGALYLLSWLLKKKKLLIFSIYCLCLAILCFTLEIVK